MSHKILKLEIAVDAVRVLMLVRQKLFRIRLMHMVSLYL